MAAQPKHIPKDAQVIISIMKEMGIQDYEPRVLTQLSEFTYRYVTGILDDSRVFANHAKKKVIDLEDVKLAVEMTTDRIFTTPPPRDILLDVARSKNNTPLPFVKAHCGLRLPPDRYCLSSCNFKLRSIKKPQQKPMHHHTLGGGGSGFINNSVATCLTTTAGMKPQPQGLSIMKRPGTLTTVARTQAITIPKPVIKFSSGPAGMQKVIAKPKIQMPSGIPTPTIKMETDDIMTSMKRKRDDEDDYNMLE